MREERASNASSLLSETRRRRPHVPRASRARNQMHGGNRRIARIPAPTSSTPARLWPGVSVSGQPERWPDSASSLEIAAPDVAAVNSSSLTASSPRVTATTPRGSPRARVFTGRCPEWEIFRSSVRGATPRKPPRNLAGPLVMSVRILNYSNIKPCELWEHLNKIL